MMMTSLRCLLVSLASLLVLSVQFANAESAAVVSAALAKPDRCPVSFHSSNLNVGIWKDICRDKGLSMKFCAVLWKEACSCHHDQSEHKVQCHDFARDLLTWELQNNPEMQEISKKVFVLWSGVDPTALMDLKERSPFFLPLSSTVAQKLVGSIDQRTAFYDPPLRNFDVRTMGIWEAISEQFAYLALTAGTGKKTNLLLLFGRYSEDSIFARTEARTANYMKESRNLHIQVRVGSQFDKARSAVPAEVQQLLGNQLDANDPWSDPCLIIKEHIQSLTGVLDAHISCFYECDPEFKRCRHFNTGQRVVMNS
eukprot:GILI01031014.1.p1 GENE.GILI01031014.1~~GILI01031014.1.p1  ORF type:complete len:311 (-),score=53.48 GILI01031014.1:133-1065(-)